MNNKTPRSGTGLLKALSAAVLLLAPAASAELVMNPKVIGASFDFGQVTQGQVEGLPLSRSGVFLSNSGTLNENLELRLTLGGLFWFAGTEQADPVNRLVKFGAGVGEAQGIYSFGTPGAVGTSRLQFGLFPVKYGPSHNLGEYLYRSGAYPGYMVSGGWSYLNSAAYVAQGARYTLPTFNGKVTHDFTLFFERDWEPLNDLTPGYALTVRPMPGVEFGGGVVWAHGIPLRGDKYITPERLSNAYSKTSGMPVAGAATAGIRDSVVFNIPGDPSSGVAAVIADTTEREAQTLRDWAACQAGDCSNIGYYTFRGFKGALRASADIGTLMGSTSMRPGDFQVYGEVALLGFKNYEYYYEDPIERMPVMLGVNIPTFGFLNRLSAEVEYRKSPFRNSIYGVNNVGDPTPVTTASGGGDNAYSYEGNANTDDDLKWSFFAMRTVYDGVNVYAQVASDHMRHPDFWGVMAPQPMTIKTSDWYYVLRVDFSL